MTCAATLVRTAFGPNADLYSDVLGLPRLPPSDRDRRRRAVTDGELRKAYRRRALLYHPDRQPRDASEADVQKATAKFHAVSAAFELLSDVNRRRAYDETGVMEGDADDDDRGGGRTSGNGDDDARRWADFFRSVFREEYELDDDLHSYRGSEREASDVLRLYATCKGDLHKVRLCIVRATEDDVSRWERDIVRPAVARGEISRYDDGGRRASRSESSTKRRNKRSIVGEQAGGSKPVAAMPLAPDSNDAGGLVDTDDEEEEGAKAKGAVDGRGETKTLRKERQRCVDSSSGSTTMSKRDKMDYRVARLRREKQEKQIELAQLAKRVAWDGGGEKKAAPVVARQRRPGTFHESLLSTWQDKYATDEGVETKPRKYRKKKKLKRR